MNQSTTPYTRDDETLGYPPATIIRFPTNSGVPQSPTPTPNPPPPPPGGNVPAPPAVTPKDPIDRLADRLGDLFGQSITIPSQGDPIVVPTQSTSGGMLPVVIVVAALAFGGYIYYTRHKGGN